MRFVATHVHMTHAPWSVTVCEAVGHTGEFCKTAKPIEMPTVWPEKKHLIHWRHLANTIEQSMLATMRHYVKSFWPLVYLRTLSITRFVSFPGLACCAVASHINHYGPVRRVGQVSVSSSIKDAGRRDVAANQSSRHAPDRVTWPSTWPDVGRSAGYVSIDQRERGRDAMGSRCQGTRGRNGEGSRWRRKRRVNCVMCHVLMLYDAAARSPFRQHDITTQLLSLH